VTAVLYQALSLQSRAELIGVAFSWKCSRPNDITSLTNQFVTTTR